MKRWYLRLELRDPVDDAHIEAVRQQLIDTLKQAGYPAKSTTADWDLVKLKLEPFKPIVNPRNYGTKPRRSDTPKGRKIA